MNAQETNSMAPVTVVSHPLVQHKLALARDKRTPPESFRSLLQEISKLMAYEVTRDLPTYESEVETPLAPCKAHKVDTDTLALVSILRAGNGLLEGILSLLPTVAVGHIGIRRDEETLEAIEYYYKMPPDISKRTVILVDPMLATGHSAIAALNRLKEDSPTGIIFMNLVASPEGIDALQKAHPDVAIVTAAVDEKLNEHSYIVPGLGDAGDRIYGTR